MDLPQVLEGGRTAQKSQSGLMQVLSRRTAHNIEVVLRAFCVLLTAADIGGLAKIPDIVEYESMRDYRRTFLGLCAAALAWNLAKLVLVFVKRSGREYPGCWLLLDLAFVVLYAVLLSLNPDAWGSIEPLPRATMAVGVVICIFQFFCLLLDVYQGLGLHSGEPSDSWFPLHLKLRITSVKKRRDVGKGVDMNGSSETLPRFEAPIEMSSMAKAMRSPELDSTSIERPGKPVLVPPIDTKDETLSEEPVSPSRSAMMTPPPRYSKKEEMASIELE